MGPDVGTANQDLSGVCDSIVDAVAVIDTDGGASSVLRAVVDEFVNKARKARDLSASSRSRDAVIELEQAADSAKAAAEADEGAADSTVEAIRQAHLAICVLKAKVLSS